MSRGFVTPTKDGIQLLLRVSPGAKRTSIQGPYGESAIRLQVAAPPVKANAEVERFLASLLGIPRSDVIRGSSSRNKVVLVRSLQQAETRQLLSAHLQ